MGGAEELSWWSPAEDSTPPAKGEARLRVLRRKEGEGAKETGLAGKGVTAGGGTAGKRVSQSRASVREVVCTVPEAFLHLSM